ncbi:MAG TPA: XdhC family protein, partial [Burkholderiaceae bacterium]|nr:XdhC family protein [Burkholderiaceae bacterium]
MDRTDQQVLRQAIAWAKAGQPVALTTVAHTWGSAPRPVGAMAAVCGDGQLIGSISGGCIEDDLIERARARSLFTLAPQRLTYGVHAEEATRFGLPCGGTVVLIVETVSAQSQLEALMRRINAGLKTTRRLDLKTGQATLSDTDGADSFILTDDALVHVLGPPWRLLLIGAGQLSHYLAHMAVACDYAVSICDPRPEITATWAVPQTSVLHGMPDDVVVAMQPDQATAIVALTHDPKLDDLALMEALKSD